MARWVAIVALLLGMGVTAFESFSGPAQPGAFGTVRAAEGGSDWPPPKLTDGGTESPAPVQYVAPDSASTAQ